MNSRSLTRDLLLGTLGFTLVSAVAFSVWAFAGRWFPREGALYTAIAAVFVILSGVVLGPLAGGMGQFYKAFVPAFLIYSVIWCAAWFGLGGKTGEWVGAIVGGAAFVVISMKLLGNASGWPAAVVVFLVLHCASYFAGDWAYAYAKAHGKELSESLGWSVAEVRNGGRMAWGVLYGLGFGAGIGWVFHRARTA